MPGCLEWPICLTHMEVLFIKTKGRGHKHCCCFSHISPSSSFPRHSNARSTLAMVQSRSTLDIVWSCLSTLILCTWVGFHPDIPASGKNSRRVVSRYLTANPVGPIIALLVPELVLAAALGQWLNQRNAMSGLREWELSRSMFVDFAISWTSLDDII
jgi:hypothetical protein